MYSSHDSSGHTNRVEGVQRKNPVPLCAVGQVIAEALRKRAGEQLLALLDLGGGVRLSGDAACVGRSRPRQGLPAVLVGEDKLGDGD